MRNGIIPSIMRSEATLDEQAPSGQSQLSEDDAPTSPRHAKAWLLGDGEG
jgi:hypothetical protein